LCSISTLYSIASQTLLLLDLLDLEQELADLVLGLGSLLAGG
jgi:hypothetical protein